MLRTLQSQLHFVRALQSVDTTGVPPLSAIREETPEALAELTIGLDNPAIKAALENEDTRGRMKRPRRMRTEVGGQGNAVEGKPGVVRSDGGHEWEPLGLKGEGASMRYFTVRTKGKNGTGE